jgi:hypothetical protein
MREQDMRIERNSQLLRSTRKNSQKRKTPAWLVLTKTAANASCFNQSRRDPAFAQERGAS